MSPMCTTAAHAFWLTTAVRSVASCKFSIAAYACGCWTIKEICRVVSQWQFREGDSDISILDFANDTRGAQLDNTDTFLGIGQHK